MRVLLFGALFGFLLCRAGATDYDAIARMFLFEDMHLAGVMGVAICAAGLGLWWLRRVTRGTMAAYAPLVVPKPIKPGLILGAVLFGVGWAVTGTCPGTGLAQIGEGRLMGVLTVVGMVLGALAYGRIGPVVEARLARRA